MWLYVFYNICLYLYEKFCVRREPLSASTEILRMGKESPQHLCEEFRAKIFLVCLIQKLL